jgi:cell shape-determining protein MreC
MPSNRFASRLYAAAVFSAIAVGLLSAPSQLTEPIRTSIRDATFPAQWALRYTREAIVSLVGSVSWLSHDATGLPKPSPECDRMLERIRRLEIVNAGLQQELSQWKGRSRLNYKVHDGTPLIVPQLLEASVLGEEAASQWRAGKLVTAGLRDGVIESSLVLDDDMPLIDQGPDAGLETDDVVFAGRVVVGKIDRVGRWVSSVRPITDGNFRSRAQLARQSKNGLVFGEQGIIEGADEPLCRLKHIGSTAFARVGDDVYSAQNDPTMPDRMYFGKVIRAELGSGSLEWEIWVKPAIDFQTLKRVQVVQRQTNPLRQLAQ